MLLSGFSGIFSTLPIFCLAKSLKCLASNLTKKPDNAAIPTGTISCQANCAATDVLKPLVGTVKKKIEKITKKNQKKLQNIKI